MVKGTVASALANVEGMTRTRNNLAIEAVVADLIRRKASKPRTQKTLLSTLHALFKKELSEQQLAALFAALCKRGVVKVEGTKISYALPTQL